jgi:hypothetical protein
VKVYTLEIQINNVLKLLSRLTKLNISLYKNKYFFPILLILATKIRGRREGESGDPNRSTGVSHEVNKACMPISFLL